MLKVATCGYIRMNDLLSRESLLLEEFLRDMANFIVRFCQFCGHCYETTPMEAVSVNDVKYYKHGLHCCSNYNLYFVLEDV
jgi:MinD superfamily P-loop ATPase